MYLSVLLLLLLSVSQYADQACEISTVPVQPDFDEEKFLGTWYEIEWWPADHFPNTTEENKGDNFAFSISRKDDKEGSLFYQTYFSFNGRTQCNTDRTMTRVLRSPGIYRMTGAGDDPYRGFTQIVWTDYTNMMVEFVCYTYSGSLCSDSAAAIWSRTTGLTSAQLNSTDKQLKQMCTAGKNMFKITHTIDCPKQDTPASTSAGILSGNIIYIFLIISVTTLFG